MKKFLITIGVFITLIIAGLLLFSLFSSNDGSGSNQEVIDVYNGGALTLDERSKNFENGTLLLSTKEGEVVQISVLFSQEDIAYLSDDFVLLFEPTALNEADVYDIYYDDLNGTILVVLHQEPLAKARNIAIKRLEEKLGVSADSLCPLSISVITNEFVNRRLSGIELGIPGCTGAVQDENLI